MTLIFFLLISTMLAITSTWNNVAVINISDWKYDEITTIDVIIYTLTFIFICLIVWLSSRQIKASLVRAERSEKLLREERDVLEQRVGERSKELIAYQEKRFAEMEHTVRVGELACGIIHDMITPLTSISLRMEELTYHPEKYCTKETYEMLTKTIEASRRMKDFMGSAQCIIDPKRIHENMITNLNREMAIIYDMFVYKARMSNVCIEIESKDNPVVPIHPLRIHQILTNLVSNAIDACSHIIKEKNEFESTKKIVCIKAEKNDSLIKIQVSDNGCGMNINQLDTLFTDQRTTKPSGTGLGLISIHSIITKELGGTITVNSAVGIGTTFNITIPLPAHL